MSPAEKVHHAKNILDNKYTKINIPNFKTALPDFLELKKLKTNIYDENIQEISSRLNVTSIENMYNLIYQTYKSLPRITFIEFSRLLDRNNLIPNKLRYLSFIAPINLRRKIYYAKKIRKMIVIYNNDIKELTKNYAMVKDASLKKKYDQTINDIKKTIFPNIFKKYEGRGKRRFNENQFEPEQKRQSTLEDFEDLENQPEIITSAARDFKDHFKYTGKEMNEGQIINRLEHLRTSIARITEFVLNVTDKKFYKKSKIQRIDKAIKRKIYEDAEVLFADDPELKNFYMKKINKELGKLSYVHDSKMSDVPMSFQQASEDLIYREYSYMNRVRIALTAMSNIKKNLEISVNKNNLVDAVSVNGVLMHLNYDYSTDFTDIKTKRPRTSFGSPTIAYLDNIKNIFESEMKQIEQIKEHKLKDLEIPNIDEAMATRKDLIENYTNKIAEFEKMKNERLEEEVQGEIDDFKFEYFVNGENFGFENPQDTKGNLNTFKEFNLDNNGVNLLDLEKELIKKEYEIIQNSENNNNPENLEEFKDVSSLVKNISNLNSLENSENSLEKNEGNSLQKSEEILKRQRLMNKGYAFVTMISSNEAVKLYLEAQLGLKIKNNICDIEPKFDKTHNSMDIERLIENSKKDSILLGKEEEIKSVQNKIFNFESSLDQKLDKKQKEIKEVISAYRDLYSDPFKKHDARNPLSFEEEEKIKFGLKKMQKETGVNNLWILEEDKLDELRKIKDKRMTKTYLDWQLLKKGIIPENVLRNSYSNNSNVLTTGEIMSKNIDSNFSEKEKFELKIPLNANNESYSILNKNENSYDYNKPGRLSQEEISDKKKFMENYLGKDYLKTETHGFQEDKRDLAIYNEIKELRERFPKELFDEKIYGNTKEAKKIIDTNLDSLIDNLNEKYISLVNNLESDKEKGEPELTKVELMDRMTNMSPVNKKLQLIITERNRLLENDEIKQNITINNFLEKTALRDINENAKLLDDFNENIQYNTVQDIRYESSDFKHYWAKDERNFMEFEYEFKEPEVKIDDTLEAPAEGDSSFNAFLIKRKMKMQEEDKKKLEEKEKENQFDSSKINIEQLNEITKNKKEKIMENLKMKYQMHLNTVKNKDLKGLENYESENANNNNNSFNKEEIEENIFDYMENKRNFNKKNFKKINEKIQLENKKAEFISQLEKNFSQEIQTLPNFQEYFNSIKKNLNPLEEKIKSDKFSVEDLKKEISYDFNNENNNNKNTDPIRDMMSVLNKGKLSNEDYEKHFLNYNQNQKNKMEKWLSEEKLNSITNEIKFSMGINKENEPEKLRILEAKYPFAFDENLDHAQYSKELMLKMEELENLEDNFESEYIFSQDNFKLLSEMVRISKLKNSKVSVHFSEEGNLVIRREFKNTYKYDLDFFMNFDLEKERRNLIEKIKVNNFLNIFEKKAMNFTRFVNIIEKNKINFTENEKKNFVEKCEELKFRFDSHMNLYFKTNLINFSDLKSALEKFDNLPLNKTTEFLKSLTKILNIPSSNKPNEIINLTRNLENLADFSDNIFIEKEILSLAYLMFNEALKHSKDNKIPHMNYEFTSQNKRTFKANVILKSLKKTLESEFSNKEIQIIKYLLGQTSEEITDSLNVHEIIKMQMWEDYKKIMNEKYSMLFKKEKEIFEDFVIEKALDMKNYWENNEIILNSSKNFKNESINKEIISFTRNMQDYYIDMAKLSKRNFV